MEIHYLDPVFQAFTLKTTSEHPHDTVEQAIRAVLGDGWRAQNYGGKDTYFEVAADEGALTAAEAWEITYKLRTQQGIAYAEPVFKAWVTDRRDWRINVGPDEPGSESELPAPAALANWLCSPGPDSVEARDNEWSLKLSRVVAAWAQYFPGQLDPGRGVVIGHPDTGYRRHPEIVSNLLIDQGFDIFRNDTDPQDELRSNFPWQTPGHGTHTASVIISPRGAAHDSQGTFVSGAAPGAKLIPFRVSDTVIILDTLNLARAIEMAVDAGAQVISISMGGVGSERLHDAVVYARNNGVIVLAAAGNCVGFVVYPAAYDEVVAVAACDAQEDIWNGSSRGNAVDVTAPGDRVWNALADPDDTASPVGQGSGTSYAVATAAGIAALWLAKHGRNTIIDACGGREKIGSAFLQLLRSTAKPEPRWPVGQFGGGLVDADRLLGEPLPDGVMTPPLAPTSEEYVAANRGGPATFGHLFEAAMSEPVAGAQALPANERGNPYDRLSARLAELLNTSREKLPIDLGQVGQELAFHLATDPSLHRQFANVVTPVQAGRATDDVDEREPPTEGSAGRDARSRQDIRERLFARGVSRALAAKLER
jgi:thermitase